MGIIDTLNDPRIVAKFQQVLGIERLPDQILTDECETSERYDSEEKYEKYVKDIDTENYVLHGRYKNNNRVTNNDLQKEGVPPFTSDDSDSENGLCKGKLYKITPHRIRYRWIYFAFRFASFFGDEAFYLTCLPFLFWNVDTYMMRQTVVVWTISMYLGQVLKDIFQWSRPATPPVVRLDVDFAQEFSLPSTHAVAASSIPLTMAFVIINRYQVSSPLIIALASLWCLMTCGSRLYLGVHSLLDVIAGCLISVTVATVILPFREEIDWFIQTSPASPIVLVSLCIALSTILYPAPEIGNNTRPDAVKIIACSCGCLLGQWGNYFNGMAVVVPPEGLFIVVIPSLKAVACAILRFMIGVMVLILVKTVVQAVTLKGVIAFFRLRKTDKHLPKVQVPYRFITYLTLGIIISWTVPILHTKFGLGRPAVYMEVI
ncbi:sphingosine-1-phosphate phosphatase 2-like [Dreissena polymorpha]|uniref:Phosphatidic acid phosphatase type 2/haloperoxidase domain-containing protein n=1 Tax=Dreissena polymorpha TaxID=45954 RepID=A0A9D4HIG3_DREPO|nr:sphingosine-1-phosphate phosphatase 2-like [Dreissena polymorpha]KAH3718638.1 hypothetical protein DPMN_061444 [Dreissena polymorpha]